MNVLANLITETVPLPAQQQRLAWDLDEKPDLLTGQGGQGSPRLLALLTALVAQGARGVVLPTCPQCGAQARLDWRLDGTRCCRRCYELRVSRCRSEVSIIGTDVVKPAPRVVVEVTIEPADHRVVGAVTPEPA